MNYIKHLNTAFKKIAADDRLTASHVSLYVSLFQCWNLNRFKNPISINRTELMKISCIGSRSTYHRNLKQLAHWNYIDYRPSKNPLLGSKVYLLPFGQNRKNTSPKSGQLADQSSTGASTESGQLPGQVVNPSTNTPNNSNSKQSKRSSPNNSKKNIPDKKKVVQYFQKKEQPQSEAEKFHNYYTGKGWKIKGDEIENWQAVADNWITRSAEFKKNDQENFNVSNEKNFSEPL